MRVTDDLSGVVVEFLEVRQGFEDLSASCDPGFPWNRIVEFKRGRDEDQASSM